MKKIFASNSYKYFNSGFKPIPLYGKRPIIKEWTSIDITEEVLDKWNDSFPDANIGILTGAASGVVCIDIDKEESIVLCPASPLVKKGSKGETRFFKYNGETAQKFHAQGIEILSDGNQTVMPPSIHPGTNSPYVWLSEVYEDLPEIPKEFLASLSKTPINVNGIAEVSYELGPLEKDRCRSNSYNKFSQMLVAKIHDGKEYNQIMSELLEYDEKENTIVSFFKCPSRPGRWHLRSREENCKKFMDEAYKKHKIEPVTEPVTKLRIEFKEEKPILYKENKLPQFRGIAQDIFTYIYNNSPVKRTRWSVASTLSLMSVTLGNRVRLFNSIYPNLYIMIIGDSATGKDFPMKQPGNILLKAGFGDLVGGVAKSEAAIYKDLTTEKNTRLDVFDEASTLFRSMGDVKNLYNSGMAEAYQTLYTSPGSLMAGRSLRDTKNSNCYSPYIVLLCGLTMDDFKETFSKRLMDKGLGSRFLYFPDKEIKLTEPFRQTEECPKHITNYIARCRNYDPDINLGITDKSLKMLNEEKTRLESFSYKNDNIYGPMIRRSGNVLAKMAIIDACSIGYESSFRKICINEDNIDWSIEWIGQYLKGNLPFLELNLTSGNEDRTYSDIEELIISAGSDGIQKNKITLFARKNRGKDVDYVNRVLKTLESEESIFKLKLDSTGGRPSERFIHKNYIKF